MKNISTTIGPPSKLQQACARLSELAHRLGPGAQMPTAVQLRESLGVSPVTLNEALKQVELRGLITRRHGVGIFVSAQLQRSISLLCSPDFLQAGEFADFWRLLTAQAFEHAQASNARLRYDFSAPGRMVEGEVPLHESFMQDVSRGEVHGVLAMGLETAATDWLVSQNVPVVAWAGYAPNTARFDTDMLIREGVRALADVGCKRLGFWRPVLLWELDTPYPQDNVEVFNEAVRSVGLPLLPELVQLGNVELAAGNLPTNAQGSLEAKQGIDIARNVFTAPRDTWPDGIVMADDILTHGALIAMQKLRVRLPQDVVVASHSNLGSPILQGYEDVLILLECDASLLVQTLFDLLGRLMAHGPVAQPHVGIPPRVVMPPAISYFPHPSTSASPRKEPS